MRFRSGVRSVGATFREIVGRDLAMSDLETYYCLNQDHAIGAHEEPEA